MLAPIKNLFAKLSNYPRLRVLLIIATVVIVFILLMNLLSPKSNNVPPSVVQPAKLGSEQHPQAVADTQAVSSYDQLQYVDQKQQLAQAKTSGATLFQNPFASSSSPSDVDNMTDTSAVDQNTASVSSASANQANSGPASDTGSVSPEQFSQQQTSNQASKQSASQLQQQLNQLQGQLSSGQLQAGTASQANIQAQAVANSNIQITESNMRSNLGNLTTSWALPSAATVSAEATSSSTTGTSPTAGPVMIKAGTIYFAVIETALDSDQPGTPVLATIVNGPYKGAKILGAFSSENKALVVQFNNMSIPSFNSTISINAYALDQNTANNAIATSVDNHYLLRYGMLFASAFLQGFGAAYQSYNYTCPPGAQNCTLINSTGTPNSTVTSTTAAYQGLGQIGTNLGNAAASVFNTPPTIKVAQGTGIGILFMSDVTAPVNQ